MAERFERRDHVDVIFFCICVNLFHFLRRQRSTTFPNERVVLENKHVFHIRAKRVHLIMSQEADDFFEILDSGDLPAADIIANAPDFFKREILDRRTIHNNAPFFTAYHLKKRHHAVELSLFRFPDDDNAVCVDVEKIPLIPHFRS